MASRNTLMNIAAIARIYRKRYFFKYFHKFFILPPLNVLKHGHFHPDIKKTEKNSAKRSFSVNSQKNNRSHPDCGHIHKDALIKSLLSLDYYIQENSMFREAD